MIVYVLNQSNSHWLLSYALQSTITMYLKLGEEIRNPFALVNLIGDDCRITFELFLFTSNIRREVCSVLDYFLAFQIKYEERKAHNMFFMPHLKAFIWYLFLLAEKKVEIYVVNEYDRRTLYPMILKCYHHLQPMTKSIGCVDQIIDKDYSLDIFQQIASTNEPTHELVTRELLIFRHYLMDPKDVKCLRQWWGKYETMFSYNWFFGLSNLKHYKITN